MATAKKRNGFERAARLRPEMLLRLVATRATALQATGQRLQDRQARVGERKAAALDKWASRLAPALARLLSGAARDVAQGRARLAPLATRLEAAPARRLAALSERLERIDRTRQSLGHAETLARGFAIVRGDGHVVTSRVAAAQAQALELEFADGRLALSSGPVAAGDTAMKPAPKPAKKPSGGGDQGSLF
jgi:exodeoxyribonuclease VII large subunit